MSETPLAQRVPESPLTADPESRFNPKDKTIVPPSPIFAKLKNASNSKEGTVQISSNSPEKPPNQKEFSSAPKAVVQDDISLKATKKIVAVLPKKSTRASAESQSQHSEKPLSSPPRPVADFRVPETPTRVVIGARIR